MTLLFLTPAVHRVFLVVGNILISVVGVCVIYFSITLRNEIGGIIQEDKLSDTVNGFVAAGLFVSILGLIGCLASWCNTPWLLILYKCFMAALIMVELGVSVTGWTMTTMAIEVSRKNGRPAPSFTTSMDQMSKLIAFTLFFLVIFQVLLIWSAYNYYANLKCFHKGQSYRVHTKTRCSKASPAVYTYRSEVVCAPGFGKRYSSPVDSFAPYSLHLETPQYVHVEPHANKLVFDLSMEEIVGSSDSEIEKPIPEVRKMSAGKPPLKPKP